MIQNYILLYKHYVKFKIITIMARPNRGTGSNGVKRPSTNTNRHQYGNGGKKSC